MANGSDIILDQNNDLAIANGDFVVANSDNQNIGILLTESRGSFKQNPIIGGNIISLLKSNFKKREIKRAISVEVNRDGYSEIDINIDFDNNKLNIQIND